MYIHIYTYTDIYIYIKYSHRVPHQSCAFTLTNERAKHFRTQLGFTQNKHRFNYQRVTKWYSKRYQVQAVSSCSLFPFIPLCTDAKVKTMERQNQQNREIQCRLLKAKVNITEKLQEPETDTKHESSTGNALLPYFRKIGTESNFLHVQSQNTNTCKYACTTREGGKCV